MPRGPRGEKRPADVVGCAIRVAKIATGEIEDERYVVPARKKSGRAGAKARIASLSAEERKRIAEKAAATRWKDEKDERPMSEKERLLRALFDSPGREHINIKFFRGHDIEVSEEDVCRAASKALFEIENGLTDASEMFEEHVKREIDVKELVGVRD